MKTVEKSGRRWDIYFLLFIIPAISVRTASAQTIPDPPRQWVTDNAGLLNPVQTRTLNERLRNYQDSTSNQIVVIIFPDAGEYPVEEFSIRLAEKWKVGQESRDNGIILAIFLRERQIRVEVGYGLEDMVPDAIAFQIAQEVIPPYFREGNYFDGIQAGIDALIEAAAGKYQGMARKDQPGAGSNIPGILIILAILIMLSLFRRRNYSSAGSKGWRSTGPFFWGGMGGRGGFGGGGGFRGGGGSFGGGGATGSW